VKDGRYSGGRGEFAGCLSVTWVSFDLSSDSASQERYLSPATDHTGRERRWLQLRQEPKLGYKTRLAVSISNRGLATGKSGLQVHAPALLRREWGGLKAKGGGYSGERGEFSDRKFDHVVIETAL
jgi:hypothetical protein